MSAENRIIVPMPDFSTLAEALAKIGELYPVNGFTFQHQDGREAPYSFPAIERETRTRGAALQHRGLVKGDRLGIIAVEPEDFILTFLAAIRTGVIPVPMYPPLYLGRIDNYLQQTEAILQSASARFVAISRDLSAVLSSLGKRVEGFAGIVEIEELAKGEPGSSLAAVRIDPDDLAFLQYTSGSTAEPRGVMITHRCLISNIRAFVGTGLDADPVRDKGVTWLPLYHDMGLIGFVLAPIYRGISVVFIPTLRFVRNPNVWMETMHAHRGTISFAPNFAFGLALRKARASDHEHWDLSCVKALGCGAEPIHAQGIREFIEFFGQRYQLPENCVAPAYGLAESTLAVTMKRWREPLQICRIDKPIFEKEAKAVPAEENTCFALEHVSCGAPLPGLDLAIMDRYGQVLPDFTEGEICLRGPSIGVGYFGNPEAWQAILRDGWLRTGDLGYLAAGELYVTGRIKDLIILNGRNIHPQVVEWLASEVEGVRKGCVVAFSRPGQNGSEELVLVVEVRGANTGKLISEIGDAVQKAIFFKPADVICLKPGSLPRTSSGKLKRHQVRRQYLSSGLP
jgi:fatty-acyl-CoA synthase